MCIVGLLQQLWLRSCNYYDAIVALVVHMILWQCFLDGSFMQHTLLLVSVRWFGRTCCCIRSTYCCSTSLIFLLLVSSNNLLNSDKSSIVKANLLLDFLLLLGLLLFLLSIVGYLNTRQQYCFCILLSYDKAMLVVVYVLLYVSVQFYDVLFLLCKNFKINLIT